MRFEATRVGSAGGRKRWQTADARGPIAVEKIGATTRLAGMNLPRRWPTVAWITAIVVAWWLGGRLGRQPAPSGPAPAATAAPVELPRGRMISPTRVGVDRDELRAIIRDEVGRASGSCDVAPAPSVASLEDEDPPPLEPALQAQADAAAAIVERAVQRGQWTADDRRQLARAMNGLPQHTVVELARALHVAINRGQLTTADGYPPLGPFEGPS